MRISREQMFMAMARTAALRSTCHRLNVGAVLVIDANVQSMGYNGAHAGHEHCGGTGCQYYVPTRGCSVIHAEVNAIRRAPASATGGELFVTHSPCVACAKLIIAVGIRGVYYETEYRDPAGVDELKTAPDMLIRRLQPSGFLLDVRTQEVIQL